MARQELIKVMFLFLIFLLVLTGCTSKKILVVNPSFLPSHAYAHTDITMDAIVNEWINISFSQEKANPLARVLHDPTGAFNNSFNITESGIYRIQMLATFTDSSPSPSSNIATRITRNGTEINGSVIEDDPTKQNAEIEISNLIHVSLTEGDMISLQFIADDADVSLTTHQTFGDHPDSAIFAMMRID